MLHGTQVSLRESQRRTLDTWTNSHGDTGMSVTTSSHHEKLGQHNTHTRRWQKDGKLGAGAWIIAKTPG